MRDRPGQPPDHERDDEEVEGEHRSEEPDVAECASDPDQRNPEECREQHQSEHRIDRGRQVRRDGRCHAADESPGADRGEVGRDLVPLHPPDGATHPATLGEGRASVGGVRSAAACRQRTTTVSFLPSLRQLPEIVARACVPASMITLQFALDGPK